MIGTVELLSSSRGRCFAFLSVGIILGAGVAAIVLANRSAEQPVASTTTGNADNALEAEWEKRFAVLASLNESDWEKKNPDRAASLRAEGVPIDHYKSMFVIAMNLSSDEGGTFVSIDDLGPYLHGMKVLKRTKYTPLEVSWKINVGSAPTWIVVDDDRGACNRRVFQALHHEWTSYAVFLRGSNSDVIYGSGVRVISDLEDDCMKNAKDPEVSMLKKEERIGGYVLQVGANTFQRLDDWDRPLGFYCVASLGLRLDK